MSEAAPQAVGNGTTQADESALAALQWGWGEAYLIGHDDEHGWWASRRDQVGALITTGDPDALWTAIVEDYDLKPVPRNLQPAP